jgi:hypothetical protein
LPAVELVMITLPPETGMDRTNDATSQPTAGHSAPLIVRMAQAPSRQVARSSTQNPIAATGTSRLY